MKAKTQDVAHGDWDLIQRLLPDGWEAQAKTLGALRRTRVIKDAPMLLRILLIHLADGCSLAETVARARELGWCHLSVVALIKRLRTAGSWLNWMCQGLWTQKQRRRPGSTQRVRAVDSTMVVEGGKTGSQWRIHYAFNLADLRCDHFELTAQGIGESLALFPVARGDLLVGDRGFARTRGIAHAVEHGGDVLVRINLENLPLFDAHHRRMQLLPRLRKLRIGTPRDWTAYVQTSSGKWIAGRVIAVRRSAQATEAIRERARRKARKNGRKIKNSTLEAAAYFMLWTTMPGDAMVLKDALAWYRMRWQIELAFKRAKSLLHLGQLPKHNEDSSRAWLQGKLLVALLIERLIVEAEFFSPWGYSIEEETAQSMA